MLEAVKAPLRVRAGAVPSRLSEAPRDVSLCLKRIGKTQYLLSEAVKAPLHMYGLRRCPAARARHRATPAVTTLQSHNNVQRFLVLACCAPCVRRLGRWLVLLLPSRYAASLVD